MRYFCQAHLTGRRIQFKSSSCNLTAILQSSDFGSFASHFELKTIRIRELIASKER